MKAKRRNSISRKKKWLTVYNATERFSKGRTEKSPWALAELSNLAKPFSVE